MDEEKSIRWERYKSTINRARKNYLANKKTVTAVFTIEEYEKIKEYGEERGLSLQGVIRQLVLEKVM